MTVTTEKLAELVNVAALRDWMAAQDIVEGPVELVGILSGGTQNVLVRVRSGDRDLVLRRGPQHLRPRTNDNLRREMRVLEALGSTDMPHARLVAACPDETVLGDSVFYLMESVDGFNPSSGLPDEINASPDARRRVCFSSIDALTTLGDVDHQAVGLGDLGRRVGFLERQVARWKSELESYTSFEGYSGRGLTGVEELGEWLMEHQPSQWQPGVMHGDYHLANILCDPRTGAVNAVIDWEMSTIGDPLLDLGVLLATWPRDGDAEILSEGVRPLAHVVTRDELLQRYASRSARDLSNIDWYIALACYKLGIILEGTYARSIAGLAPRPTGERLHKASLELFDRAREVIGA